MKTLVERLREISLKNNRNRILKNYYSKELKKGKTHRASILDKALLYLLMYLIINYILLIYTNRLLPSILISALLIYFIMLVNAYFSNKFKSKKIREINEELKKKKLIREFSDLNRKELVDFIKNMLEEYYHSKIEKGEEPLDLILEKDGDLFGIKCIRVSNMEDRIGTREVELFSREIKALNLSNGILITNTEFSDGLQAGNNIILIGFNNIIDILKEIGKYPSDEEIEDYIVDRFVDRRNSIKSQIKDFNKKKIIQLYGLCAIFYLLSYFISFPRYYKIMAVLSFLIASLVAGYKITEYIKLKDSFNIDKSQ